MELLSYEKFVEEYKKFHKEKYNFKNHKGEVISKGCTSGELLGMKDSYIVLKKLLQDKEE